MGYIILLALGLRLVLINSSLWLDESIQALALMGKMGPLMQYALADYQPPLYHLIGYVFTQVFGYSEIALRLPSLVAGICTVYFVIKIGELVATKRIGIIAGLLAATNPLLIYYSGEGRTYALTTFFVTASFYYFIRLLQDKNSSKLSSIFYLLFTCAFLWTSYLSWFLLLAQAIYVIWKKRYDLLLIQIVAGLTLIAWLPSLIASLGIGRSTMNTSPEWGRVVGGLTWKSLPLTWVKFVLGRISFDNKLLYGAIVSLVGIAHLFVLSRSPLKKYPTLLVWLVPPLILGIGVASILPVFSYFRVLFILPAYLLLLAIALSSFKSWKMLILIVGIQLTALIYFWASPRYHHEDWRGLVRDLPADAVLALPSRAQNAPLRYYGYDRQVIEPSHEPLVGEKIYYIKYVEDLFDTGKLGQTNFAKSGYTSTSQKVYAGIQVDIYENSR
jgi:mannosyltransferase